MIKGMGFVNKKNVVTVDGVACKIQNESSLEITCLTSSKTAATTSTKLVGSNGSKFYAYSTKSFTELATYPSAKLVYEWVITSTTT